MFQAIGRLVTGNPKCTNCPNTAPKSRGAFDLPYCAGCSRRMRGARLAKRRTLR